MDDAKQKTLIMRRGVIKGQLTRFKNQIINVSGDKLNHLKARLHIIEPLLNEFNEVQLEIESGDEQERAQGENVRESFENDYFNAVGDAKQLIAQYELPVRNSSSDKTTAMVGQSDLELKKFTLPTFSGDFEKWYQFKNTFIALVDSNSKLDKVRKFYRLLECVKDEALKVISELEVSEQNYDVAWDMLVSRFEDKPAIIQKHLKAIIDYPGVQRESPNLIRSWLDDFNMHSRALKSLGEPIDHWDSLLILLLSRKLDSHTRGLWNEARVAKLKGVPKVSDFITFLMDRCKGLEASYDKENVSKKGLSTNAYHKREDKALMHTVVQGSLNCGYCKGQHFIYRCSKLLELSVSNRRREIKKLKLCMNCLRSGHWINNCISEGCKRCKGRHNTLLHEEKDSKEGSTSPVESIPKNQGQTSFKNDAVNLIHATTTGSVNGLGATGTESVRLINMHAKGSTASQVLLSTAIVLVADGKGKFHRARCLLDSGSQSSFMTTGLAKRLNLSITKFSLPVVGVSQSMISIEARTQTIVKSAYNNFKANLQLLLLDKISVNIPIKSFDLALLKVPKNFNLADPECNRSAGIDLLLGVSIFFEILCAGQIKLGTGLPILQKSLFGWILAGEMFNLGKLNTSGLESNDEATSCHLVTNEQLSEQVRRFWQIEDCNENLTAYSSEEFDCERNFLESYGIDEQGRFMVKLPMRKNVGRLGESYQTALSTLLSVERKLDKNEKLKEKYIEFMREYISLGHMTKIELEGECELSQQIEEDRNIFYLPHHGVINESSATTKLRVVFNGSAKSSTGVSLNDVLSVGPCIQEDLFTLLCRFRIHSVVITADIAKMYRMVQVHESQRDLQRILWRQVPGGRIEHFRLNTLTYGTGPASFLATRCLKQVAILSKERYPKISTIIERDFYVDDLITGAESTDEAIELGKALLLILGKYGFHLRKWNSNSGKVLEGLSEGRTAETGYFITDEGVSKALGIFWNASADYLEYVLTLSKAPARITKRTILSIVSKLFDPLGLVGPVTVKAKLILQQLWSLKLSWDESIPLDLFSVWNNFQNQLSQLRRLRIERQVRNQKSDAVELHGFCDASEKASGACIYVKSKDSTGKVKVSLLCAKSKIAPLKTISLPRLELCGAVLLTRLMKRVLKALEGQPCSCFYWCDSTIVLAWISDEPRLWKTFVAHRVTEIQQNSCIQNWNHVRSKQNPADIISRGAYPNDLLQADLWWKGPDFLYGSDVYGIGTALAVPDEVPERRRVALNLFSVTDDVTLIERFSSLGKLQRVIAWCFRFFNNSRNHPNRITENLTIEELNHCLRVLIKITQTRAYGKEFHDLEKFGSVSNKSHIKALSPIIGSDELLRVGGRIAKAHAAIYKRFPIVLPAKHHLTRLIINQEHLRQLHAGPQGTLTAVRQRFWLVGGRREVRSVLSRCLVCFRAKPKGLSQKMGNLPEDRVTINRPFLVSGTDFAGPFNIKANKLRNRVILKAYMCIYVCFTTKAVHIEAVSELTTNAFLDSLKRFVARRGICRHVYSDNASNFIGANNEFIKLNQLLNKGDNSSAWVKYCNDNSITWHFIPSRSPHQGGLWEAAVKAAKHHVTRIIGDHALTFEELTTVFAQIEAVLNSRPLTEMSSDPNDLTPLTPGHFLIGSPLTSIPDSDITNIPDNRIKRYDLMRKIIQHFWKRWENEYLTSLQKRTKWQHSAANLKVGWLVILREDNLPPMNWRMGRVLELHPGSDGLVRVASIKTSTGVVKRAVQKICVLPLNS